MTDFREICHILVGYRIGSSIVAHFMKRQFSGKSTHVEFSWELAMKEEESEGDVVGFFHTHPPGLAQPSVIDEKTMAGWVLSFGKPLLCVIESEGVAKAFLFNEESYGEVALVKSYNLFCSPPQDPRLKTVFIAG